MVIRKTNEDTAASSNAMLGLSGLDTASMLKSIMAPYKKPIVLALQKQQLVTWKQERYRSFITKINELKATYFDYKTPATNMLAEGTFKSFVVDNPGSQYVKIKTTIAAKQGPGTIEVDTMPTATSLQGRTGIATPVEGVGVTPDWTLLANRTFTINMDGLVRSVTFDKDIGTAAVTDKYASVQNSVDKAFGPGQIKVDSNALGALRFTEGPGVGRITIITSDSDTASYMGFTSSANHSNRLNMDSTLTAISARLNTKMEHVLKTIVLPDGSTDQREFVEFSINGVDFEFDMNTHMSKVMETVNNNAAANVTMKYDGITGAFSITSDVCGPGDNVNLSESATRFFGAIGLTIPNDMATPPTGLIEGGVIDTTFVNMATDARTAGSPYEISVKVNGVEGIVRLDNVSMGGGPYVNPSDIVADINKQLDTLFPNAGLSVSLAQIGTSSDWRFDITVDGSKPAPAQTISVAPVSSMSASDADALFTAMGLNALPRHTTGVFGKVIIDGTRITVDRKDFEYEGIEYTLVKETPAGQPVDYTISVDTDSVVEKIRGFVDAYNSLISMLKDALSEPRYGEGGGNSYQPLTDEQREGMSESEVEKWEEKSKLGLLRNDTLFVSMMTKIRLSVFNPIYTEYSSEYRDGKFTESFSAPLGSNLEALGIFTEKWEENGQLHIDETKLREAIEKDINNVARVFSNQPPEVWGLDLKEAKYNETTEYAKRARLINDKTGGVMYKLLAVLDDYVRVTRDTSGAKGYLLERAGMASDQSDTSNVLTREIYEYNRRINSLWDRYDRIEAEKIKLLSRLETYVTQAGQQMSWITAQMSSGS